MTKAIIVCGASSSGNRLLTRLLIECGAYGDGKLKQRLDRHIPAGHKCVAWARSYPYRPRGADMWIDMATLIKPLVQAGYTDISVAVITRDWLCTALSQRRNKHSVSVTEAYDKINRAYRVIFENIVLYGLPYVMVNYERLVSDPLKVIQWVAGRLGLEAPEQIREQVYNANEKYSEIQ